MFAHQCAFLLICLFLHPVNIPRPEFSYRPGLVAVTEDSNGQGGSSGVNSAHPPGGPPNRPLPPTPDDDDAQGDRTLVMKRVSLKTNYTLILQSSKLICFITSYEPFYI